MYTLKKTIQKFASRLGYDVRRTPSLETTPALGVSPFSDMKQFVPTSARPLILDVGANLGQSVDRFKEAFPSSVIHSFEPSPETFQKLSRNIAGQKGVQPWNCAVGASVGKQVFAENTNADMSSFLELSTTGWGEVAKESTVEVTTIDRFLEDQGIAYVDVLKSDTQGYELEVFKGAEQAMRNQKIGLIYFEFIFSEMYKNLPPFDEVFRHLTDRNFSLVSIYDVIYQNRLAGWCDALFVNKEYCEKSA